MSGIASREGEDEKVEFMPVIMRVKLKYCRLDKRVAMRLNDLLTSKKKS